MYKHICLVVFFICFSFGINAQYQLPDLGFVFEDKTIARIDIEIDQDSLSQILDANNLNSNHEYPATFSFSREGTIEKFDTIGFRLRGNTSRGSGKKSFKVSFNTFENGGKFHGLEKMNLNGEHNDPSILRSKISWDYYGLSGIIAARTNHVLLYINNEYKGIYINVEHIDEEFVKLRLGNSLGNLYKCLYPADLAYLGDFQDLYKEEANGRRIYDLKTNQGQDDYSDLANFIDILNNYSGDEFQCRLEEIFDVENYLKVIVWDILTSNWDGPIVNQNNFYLYNDPNSGKFVYIPYDLDNTFGIGWGNVDWANTDIYDWSNSWFNTTRPIYENIMKVKEYKDKVSYYFDHFIELYFNNEHLDPYFDFYRTLISPYRADDVFAGYDYGWDYDDFIQSFTENVGSHVNYGLKEYVDERSISAFEQLEINSTLPTLEAFSTIISDGNVKFSADIFWPFEDVGSPILHYRKNGSAWEEKELIAIDNTTFNTELEIESVDSINYYFEAGNFAGKRKWPFCGYKSVLFNLDIDYQIVINEFMASNDNGIEDEFGEREDWLELYNNSAEEIFLSQTYMTDNPDQPGKWKMPNITFAADSYAVFYADNDPDQGSLHTNFKLSKNGEFLGLYQKVGDQFFPLDTLTFQDQQTDQSFGRLPNGIGDFQVLPFPTFGYNNEGPQSTEQTENKSDFLIYPNPTSNFINIKYKVNDKFIYQVAMYSVSGSHAYNLHYDEWSSGVINLRNMSISPGIYFLSLTLNDGTNEVRKIIFSN